MVLISLFYFLFLFFTLFFFLFLPISPDYWSFLVYCLLIWRIVCTAVNSGQEGYTALWSIFNFTILDILKTLFELQSIFPSPPSSPLIVRQSESFSSVKSQNTAKICRNKENIRIRLRLTSILLSHLFFPVKDTTWVYANNVSVFGSRKDVYQSIFNHHSFRYGATDCRDAYVFWP